MDKEVKKHMVGGYEFNTKEDAQLAKDELNAIKYVSAKTNTKDPKQVYNLYNKIIERKLFSTQIGMNYLKQLQTFLYKSSEIPNDKSSYPDKCGYTGSTRQTKGTDRI